MRSLFEQSPYLVLLGGPGSGKSTLTRYITWSHAKANLTPSAVAATKNPVLLAGKPVPLRIELRLLSEARKKHNGGFLSYATEVMLREEDISIHTQMFIELLERKMMLVLFDGLDEVPTLSERQQLIELVENFAQRYPGNHMVVTSRPVGYEIARFSNPWFIHTEIQEFNDEQIQAFLEGWYTYVLKFPFLTGEVRRELDMFYTTLRNNSRLHKLAANPLLLTVMVALHRYKRLPDKRVELYAECADLLLDTWARLKYRESRWKDMKLGKANQKDCIAHLGLFLHTRSQEEHEESDTSQESQQSAEDAACDVPSEDIQREIERFLKSENLLAGAEINAEAERFLDLVKTEAGLIVERGTDERGPLYGFVHRTFQEYFAAVAVFTKQEDDRAIISDFLEEHLHDPHWNEVILLLIGQLRPKQVTILLRHLLKGELKSRRSEYTDIVQQDLFFICACLAEEIVVEHDFAEDVISRVGDVVRHSHIPLQREEALDTLFSLMMTKQYGDRGRKELVALVTKDTIQDIDIVDKRIQAAQLLYRNISTDLEEQQAAQALLNLVQHIDLSSEQIFRLVWDLYKPDYNKPGEATQFLLKLIQSPDLPVNLIVQIAHEIVGVVREHRFAIPDELRQLMRVLLELAQRPDLSLKEKIQVMEQTVVVANGFDRIKPPEADELKERQEVIKILRNLIQLPDCFFEQRVEIFKIIYRFSTERSEERQQAVQMLSSLVHLPDLSFEQKLYIMVGVLDVHPPQDSEERALATQILSGLARQSNLSFEQTLRVAKKFYDYPYQDWEAKQLRQDLLSGLVQRHDLSFEQSLQIVEALGEISLSGGETKQGAVATQILLTLNHRPDLSIEQTLQVAQALCENSPSKSEEYHRAVQILLDLLNKPNLSFEQQVQAAGYLYQYSFKNSQEERMAMQKLLQLAQDQSYSFDDRLQAFKAPLAGEKDNYQDILQAVRAVLTMIQGEAAKQYFAEYWRSRLLFINVKSSDISFLIDLIKQGIAPGKICDHLYRQLRDMVPQFDKINTPDN